MKAQPAADLIPQLTDYMAVGHFPIECAITFYDLADINQAAEESASEKTIKPVLRTPH